MNVNFPDSCSRIGLSDKTDIMIWFRIFFFAVPMRDASAFFVPLMNTEAMVPSQRRQRGLRSRYYLLGLRGGNPDVFKPNTQSAIYLYRVPAGP